MLNAIADEMILIANFDFNSLFYMDFMLLKFPVCLIKNCCISLFFILERDCLRLMNSRILFPFA